MKANITKDVLKKLCFARGTFDSDSGKVFEKFIGRLEMADGLYHGELLFSDAGDDLPTESISISGILGATLEHEPPPESYTTTESEEPDGNA